MSYLIRPRKNSQGKMELQRRRFMQLAAGAAAFPAVPRPAWAQGYPTRPVHIVVGYSAGGNADILARLIGQSLAERLGQPFVIDNRPGAGTNIATEAVVRASPDGYTVLQVGPANTINTTLYDKLNFNFIRDIAPVAPVIRQPLVMAVTPSLPVGTVAELIAYAKANSGKLNFASGGIGSPLHVAGELFKMMAGVDMLHVPYRGVAPALTDLMAGRVQVMFPGPIASIEHIRTGKVRALGVTSATRLDVLPELPTVGDFVPGYEASGLHGIGGPKNTPAEVIEKLNTAINAAVADPNIKIRLANLGGTVVAGSAADFGALLAEETGKWSKVVKFAKLRAE